jgi:hypothetical protein
VPRDRGQSRDGLAVLGCPAPGSAGQSPSALEALHAAGHGAPRWTAACVAPTASCWLSWLAAIPAR